MSAWRRIAFAGFVSSATITAAGFGVAVETGSDSVSPRLAHGIILAQATPKPAPGVSPEDAAKVSPEEAAKVSPEVAAEELPVFTDEYMRDQANIDAGKEVWVGTCAGCHGARAYPGKAPKLKPKKYKPDFVFHQVTFGSKNGKMPPFGDAFTREERMAVVSWVLSKKFSP
jgi:mono/diheme cytochrome c family protein